MKWYKGDTGTFDKERWDEKLEIYPLKNFKKFTRIRIVGEPIKVHTHWISFYSTVKEGLTKAGLVCPRMDPDTGEFRKKIECSGCDVAFTAPETKKGQEFKKKRFRTDISYYAKIIIRPFQKVGKTYVRNTRIPTSVYNAVSELSDLAFTAIQEKYGAKIAKKFEAVFDPAHPKLGFDFLIKYNPNSKTPANAYSVQFVGITPLTDKEKKAVGDPNISGNMVKAATNENITQLLSRAGLLKLIEEKSTKSKNADGIDDDVDTDKDEEGDYTYNDIMEMDKDALVELISDMELSIKKPKLLPLKKLRKRVAEEMELEESEDEEENEKSLSSYIDKLDDMDKDALIKLIEERDLDIPKPKAKPISKLRKLIEIELSSLGDDEEDDSEENYDDKIDDDEADDFFSKDDDDIPF